MPPLFNRKTSQVWGRLLCWIDCKRLDRLFSKTAQQPQEFGDPTESVGMPSREFQAPMPETSSQQSATWLSSEPIEALRVDAINTSLIWNAPILQLMKNTCYEAKFEQHSIEVFINRGILINDIEFSEARIGKFSLDNIQNERFRSITFIICSPLSSLEDCLHLWASTNVDACFKNNQLTLTYTGNNSASVETESLIAPCNDRYIDVEQLFNSDIRTIRNFAKIEYRSYAYQKGADCIHDRCLIYLKRVRLRGFKDVEFSASFDGSKNKVTSVGALLGSSLVQIEHIIRECNDYYGHSIYEVWSESKDSLDTIVWSLNQLAIEIHRCLIPRAEPEQYRYELLVQDIASWRKSMDFRTTLLESLRNN